VRAISKLWFSLALSAIACEDADPPAYSGDSDAGDVPVRELDRSAFSDVGLGARLDYAAGEHWACRPDIAPNACMQNIDATEIKADGSKVVHKHEPTAQPAFDCFYVYPTVWISRTAQMTDFSDEGLKFVLDPLLSQAARFNSVCRLYAPMYRQAGLNGVVLADGADKQLPLQDVRDAFAYYLEHDNAGRGFVLLGHSQGAFMLTSMISLDIDQNSAVRERMISAVLLGAQPYAPPGEKVGGSFKHIEACREPGQTGCVIAYNSFASAVPPGPGSLVGRVTDVFANEAVDSTGEVFCTEPAALAQNSGRYRGSYLALKLNNPSFAAPTVIPGVDTSFVVYRDYFRGTCQHKDGAHYLSISEEPTENDARRPQYRNTLLEAVGFGTHLVDYGLALEDLLDAVALQANNMSR
jgi:hypothetical protein